MIFPDCAEIQRLLLPADLRVHLMAQCCILVQFIFIKELGGGGWVCEYISSYKIQECGTDLSGPHTRDFSLELPLYTTNRCYYGWTALCV